MISLLPLIPHDLIWVAGAFVMLMAGLLATSAE
jgi:hypothetical protein